MFSSRFCIFLWMNFIFLFLSLVLVCLFFFVVVVVVVVLNLSKTFSVIVYKPWRNVLILAFFASFRLILDFTLSDQKTFSVFLKIDDIFVFCGFLVDFETYEFESNMAGSSNSSMAGSKRKAEFELKREIYEKIAPNLACSFCEIVPRSGPLFVSKSGNILACSNCKNEKLPNGIPIACTEAILKGLPLVACQYQKNDCKIVQDPKNISYHEEECEFRDVECIIGNCLEIVAYSNLTKHMVEVHEISISNPSGIMFKSFKFVSEFFFFRCI